MQTNPVTICTTSDTPLQPHDKQCLQPHDRGEHSFSTNQKGSPYFSFADAVSVAIKTDDALTRSRLVAATNEKWGALIRQFCFVLLFSLSWLDRGSDPFWISRGIESQAVKMEFLPADVPNTAKTFEDIETVLELQQWMQGPMLETFFGKSTFDGKTDIRFPNSDGVRSKSGRSAGVAMQDNNGFILGFNKIIGSVRIAQLRSKELPCKLPTGFSSVLSKPVSSVTGKPSGAAEDYEWNCYADIDYSGKNPVVSWVSSSFDGATEDTASFDAFTVNGNTLNGITLNGTSTPYLYNGITSEGDAVTEQSMWPASERQKLFSSYWSKERRVM
jgi:hypothetical protein